MGKAHSFKAQLAAAEAAEAKAAPSQIAAAEPVRIRPGSRPVSASTRSATRWSRAATRADDDEEALP